MSNGLLCRKARGLHVTTILKYQDPLSSHLHSSERLRSQTTSLGVDLVKLFVLLISCLSNIRVFDVDLQRL